MKLREQNLSTEHKFCKCTLYIADLYLIVFVFQTIVYNETLFIYVYKFKFNFFRLSSLLTNVSRFLIFSKFF